MTGESGVSPGFLPGGWGTRLFFAVWKTAGRILGRPGRAGEPPPSRIVVARFGYMGDGILATTVLAPLREAWPDAAIDVFTFSSARPVFAAHPSARAVFSSPVFDAESFREVATVLSFAEIRRIRDFLRHADMLLLMNHILTPGGCLKYRLLASLCGEATVVGLDTDGRGTFLDVKVPDAGLLRTHEVAILRELLAAVGVARSLGELEVHVGYGKEAVRRAEILLEPLAGRPFAVFHAGSGVRGWRASKRLDAQLWVDLGLRLGREYGLAAVLVGTESEADENREIGRRMAGDPPGGGAVPDRGSGPAVLDLTGKTGLSELAALIGKASLFVGTDSGVAHAAAATGTPGITLFTFSDWIGYAPWSGRMRVVTTHAECGPCLYRHGYRECRDRSCFEIPVDAVMEHARALLNEAKR